MCIRKKCRIFAKVMAKKSSIFRLRVGHGFSRWFLFPICYHLIRYRRKVVAENLQLAFPEKSSHERKHIERKFYLYFCDMIMEILVDRHFTDEDMRMFLHMEGSEDMRKQVKQYGGGFIMLGHLLNWEWYCGMAKSLSDETVRCAGVYKTLHSKFFDDLMYKWRMRRCGGLVEMNQLLRVLVGNRQNPESHPTIYAMLADQRPNKHGRVKAHPTVLLHRQVGVLTGTEQLAKKFDLPIYYAHCIARGRGDYQATFVPIYNPETDKDVPMGEITERFTRLLEKNILEQPERWLWTHRRFAGSQPADNVK